MKASHETEAQRQSRHAMFIVHLYLVGRVLVDLLFVGAAIVSLMLLYLWATEQL